MNPRQRKTIRPTRALRSMLAVFVGVFVLGLAAPALANIAHYDVRVDGLACPFCVRGLKKKLGELPGVRNVDVNLEQGRATFDVASDTVLLPAPVREAVVDAGFSPREINVRATGTVQGSGDDLRLDVGDGHQLRLRSGDAFARLQALVQDGHRSLAVTGLVTRADSAWVLRVDAVRRLEGGGG